MSLSRALYPRARARFEVSMCTQTALHSLVADEPARRFHTVQVGT